MRNKKLFFGGVPTDPEVKRIQKVYNELTLEEGTIIPYEDIEDIINESRETSRFKSVTTAWRKHVEKTTCKVIGCVPGEAFKVLTDVEKLKLSGCKLKGAARSARRAYVVCNYVDTKKIK